MPGTKDTAIALLVGAAIGAATGAVIVDASFDPCVPYTMDGSVPVAEPYIEFKNTGARLAFDTQEGAPLVDLAAQSGGLPKEAITRAVIFECPACDGGLGVEIVACFDGGCERQSFPLDSVLRVVVAEEIVPP